MTNIKIIDHNLTQCKTLKLLSQGEYFYRDSYLLVKLEELDYKYTRAMFVISGTFISLLSNTEVQEVKIEIHIVEKS